MREKFAISLGWIIGLAVFGGWMSIVGNPHVIETSIGLVMAVSAGLWIYFKLNPKNKGKK
ncbi:MAG: hypothetical protein WC390_07945 [Sulfurimonas sp.]